MSSPAASRDAAQMRSAFIGKWSTRSNDSRLNSTWPLRPEGVIHMPNIREVRTSAQADQEDLFFGQTVLLWARWSVIVAGIVLVLWTAKSISYLTATMPFFLV